MDKIDFEKSAKYGQNVKGLNLNFLTILDHIWDCLERLEKAYLGIKKRF